MTNEKLLPCPFCGAPAREGSSSQLDGLLTAYIECANFCGANVTINEFFERKKHTPEQMTKAAQGLSVAVQDIWNTRTCLEPSSDVVELLDELMEEAYNDVLIRGGTPLRGVPHDPNPRVRELYNQIKSRLSALPLNEMLEGNGELIEYRKALTKISNNEYQNKKDHKAQSLSHRIAEEVLAKYDDADNKRQALSQQVSCDKERE